MAANFFTIPSAAKTCPLLISLQRGEEIKFANGESFLFLINAREAKTFEGQRKELELVAKIQQANVRLRWAAGSFSIL